MNTSLFSTRKLAKWVFFTESINEKIEISKTKKLYRITYLFYTDFFLSSNYLALPITLVSFSKRTLNQTKCVDKFDFAF